MHEEIDANLCVIDDDLLKMFVRLLAVVVDMKQGLEEVDKSTAILNTNAIYESCVRAIMGNGKTYCKKST